MSDFEANCVKGIGVDLVFMPSLTKKIKSEAFLKKVLTLAELDLFTSLTSDKRQIEFLSRRIAAKEAFMKASRNTIGQDMWKAYEILTAEDGCPLSNQGMVSISHHNEYAIAFVII